MHISSAAEKFASGNFVTEGTTNKVGVTLSVMDPTEANPLVLVQWVEMIETEWIRSEYLRRNT